MSLKKVVAAIKRNKRFLITAHTSLEGDALGSELAFFKLLKRLGKQAVIINEDSVPSGYDFLPGAKHAKKYKNNLKGIKFDCFAVLDCSDLKRTGEVYKLNAKHGKPVLNIDHHISNQGFADVNWVDSDASSCSEMIYRLYKRMRLPIDKDTAINLYVGMLTDTGSFRFTNTTGLTHAAVAELLRHDFNLAQIYRNIYENIPYSDMKLLCRAMSTMKTEASGGIAWFQVRQSMLRNKKLSFDLTEHLLSCGRSIKDVEVAVLFKENLGVKDEIRVNFRSQGKVDVNKIAQFFGGGGHRTASGATIKGRFDRVRRSVLAKIKDSLRQAP